MTVYSLITAIGKLYVTSLTTEEGISYGISYNEAQALEDAKNNIQYATEGCPNWIQKPASVVSTVSNPHIITGAQGLIKKFIPEDILKEYSIFLLRSEENNEVCLCAVNNIYPSLPVLYFVSNTIQNCLFALVVEYCRSFDSPRYEVKHGVKKAIWTIKQMNRLPKVDLHEFIK